jgi:hypothetical protein
MKNPRHLSVVKRYTCTILPQQNKTGELDLPRASRPSSPVQTEARASDPSGRVPSLFLWALCSEPSPPLRYVLLLFPTARCFGLAMPHGTAYRARPLPSADPVWPLLCSGPGGPLLGRRGFGGVIALRVAEAADLGSKPCAIDQRGKKKRERPSALPHGRPFSRWTA